MMKVQSLFVPVKVVASPLPSPSFEAGDEVVLDTNVPAFILYTLDGSIPQDGALGTFKQDAPVTIKISTTTVLKFKAIDNRLNQDFNQTKTQTLVYTVTRNNPAEIFRDNKHFFKKLDGAIVDHNFYVGGGKWVVPTSNTPYTYLFKNIEGFPVIVRLLQNGIDALNTSSFPRLNPGDTIEFPVVSRSGDNNIEIQTEEAF
jgi:hypothetical protein